MLPFQRRIRDQVVPLTVTPIGQLAIFEATVPIDEAWRMISVTLAHDDSVEHEMVWIYIPRLGVGGTHVVARFGIPVGQGTPIYESFTAVAAINSFAPRGPKVVEFYANDVVQFLDLIGSVDDPVNWALRIRYELIPLPLEQELTTEWTSRQI